VPEWEAISLPRTSIEISRYSVWRICELLRSSQFVQHELWSWVGENMNALNAQMRNIWAQC
jgi:hypothetical protein